MIGRRLTPTRISLAGFLVVLAIGWFAYQPALSGAFQLDDVPNLEGLAAVDDQDSAWNFILTGTAGPTGRPLALVTFALQADDWERGAEPFIRINIFLHLLNAALLAAFLCLLGRAQPVDRNKAVLVAVLAASSWVLMPLLASASLHVVQRMTTLSATFSLLGLSAYLVARRRLDSAPIPVMALMSASLVFATALSMLVKETGAVLPVLVLVLEMTLLAAPANRDERLWRAWKLAFLVLPAIALLAYLASRAIYSDAEIARRGFTGGERLLTQLSLLWVYLKKALLGLPSTLGLYQAPPALSPGLIHLPTLAAALGWAGLAIVSIVHRRRWPLLSFAVLWYLAGHVLESTVLPLELYFEHRNYLPIVGPVYAAVAWFVSGPTRRRYAGIAAVSVYLAANAMFLYSFASMSGEPSASSRYWALRYPDSVRAVTTMAGYQLVEEGAVAALSTLDRFVIAHPEHAYLRVQELNIRCLSMPLQSHETVIAELDQSLPAAEFTYTAGTMLSQLFSTITAVVCNGVDATTVAAIAHRLYENPAYRAVTGYGQFHHKLLAGIARHQGRYDESLRHLEQAIAIRPSSELNMMMVTALGGAGEFDRARQFMDEAMTHAPRHPVWRSAWRSDLDNLREYIDELERYSRGEN